MATFQWKEMNGPQGAPVSSVITHLKHKTKDTYANNADYPVPKPAAGYNYGFGKTTFLDSVECTENFSNFKLYGTGYPSANPPKIAWTGNKLFIGDEVSDTYDEVEGTESETGIELATYHSEVTAVTDFLTTYTSGNKKSIGLTGGAASKTGTGRFTKNIFWQHRVDNTSGNGLLNEASIIGVYDLA